jgi:alanyl-tRNA synthetase
MKSEKIREKFRKYFEKGTKHKWVESSSLIPTNDRTALFTIAGMQQFRPYFLGEKDAEKDYKTKNLISIQKCFRTTDIDLVGDETHLTFFEMLGNFSIGGYFKEEAIKYAFEFLTKILKINKKRLWPTVFEGDKKVIKDHESFKIWQKYFPSSRIKEFGREHNWWGPPGATGPCGPCSEIHYDLTQKPCSRGEKCQPNCQCGRFTEIWNLVFMQYYLDQKKKLTELPKKNIDTGMSLERLAMILQKKKSVYETDLFAPIIETILNDKYLDGFENVLEKEKRLRIISDHLRGAIFLISDGVNFGNKEQGYILRRIYRRAIDQFKYPYFSLEAVVQKIIEIYSPLYPFLANSETKIIRLFDDERVKYDKVLRLEVEELYKKIPKDLKKTKEEEKMPSLRRISASEAFHLYSTHGLTPERIRGEGFDFDQDEFKKEVEKHKNISRAGKDKKFGGHGLKKEMSESEKYDITKLHTATHLLQQSLKDVLGNEVKQMGSDINPDRLRFDFSFSKKLTDAEKNKVEEMVNNIIKENIAVNCETISYNEAIEAGALAYFREKYPDTVKVYQIGNYSKEICAGPHVKNTGELGHFKIISEKSSSQGVRRIKAILE